MDDADYILRELQKFFRSGKDQLRRSWRRVDPMRDVIHHAEALLAALRVVEDDRIEDAAGTAREALFALLDAVAETGVPDEDVGAAELLMAG